METTRETAAGTLIAKEARASPRLLNRERAVSVMERHSLDALVATTPENVYYASDYAREPPFHTGREHNAAILPRDDRVPATLFVEEFELPGLVQAPTWMAQVRVQSGGYTVVRESWPPNSPEGRFQELLAETRPLDRGGRLEQIADGLRSAGLDTGSIGVDSARILTELRESALLPDARLVDAREIFREIRVVKTEAELAAMKTAARKAEVAVATVAATIGEGVTCRELVRTFRIAMATEGAYGSHISYGGGTRPWVGFPDLSYTLKNGDVLFIDPAGEYEHYWTDFGRSAFVGPPSEKFLEHYGAVRYCHEHTVPSIRAGETFGSIRRAATEAAPRSIVEGFLPLVHSMGLEQYDHPRASQGFTEEDLDLEVGMVINFETLYFELGWGVLQLEDTYVVTNGPPDRITSRDREPILV
jgi:Xaa-Pro dipeptidase